MKGSYLVLLYTEQSEHLDASWGLKGNINLNQRSLVPWRTRTDSCSVASYPVCACLPPSRSKELPSLLYSGWWWIQLFPPDLKIHTGDRNYLQLDLITRTYMSFMFWHDLSKLYSTFQNGPWDFSHYPYFEECDYLHARNIQEHFFCLILLSICCT